jgi:hypothetical protein
MTTPQASPLGFDAFFSEITNSREFQDLKKSGTDISSLSDLEQSLTDMQSEALKAANMMRDFDVKFIPPPTSPSKDSGTVAPKTGDAKTEETKPAVEVQHFTRVEWKPWGFNAVAGMDDLKTELGDSFIKPLRFKFMVEKLKKQDEEKKENIW